MKNTTGCVWFRRDLRVLDNTALYHALLECSKIHCVFIFDKNILSKLPRNDRRVSFIYESLNELHKLLQDKGLSLEIIHGNPIVDIPSFLNKINADNLYLNKDYEPYAKNRDLVVSNFCLENKIQFKQFKDSVIFESKEVLSQSGFTYKVYTPYKNKWLEKLYSHPEVYLMNYTSKKTFITDKKLSPLDRSILEKEKFIYQEDNILKGGTSEALALLKSFLKIADQYSDLRDLPSVNGTSNLSTYLRHGNISVRHLLRESLKLKNEGAQKWIQEIIWRDFYQTILDQYPHVVSKSFKQQYDDIKWKKDSKLLNAWKNGMTGYPIIDAAMRCLNQTGLMHNRLRMVVASFFCKTLLLDWKLGEEYFAIKLLDFDLAANNGGWQWCASTGTDAQPYFRIFNPYTQTKKFDPKCDFIKKWCPELKDIEPKYFFKEGGLKQFLNNKKQNDLFIEKTNSDYPEEIISYAQSRQEALDLYKQALN